MRAACRFEIKTPMRIGAVDPNRRQSMPLREPRVVAEKPENTVSLWGHRCAPIWGKGARRFIAEARPLMVLLPVPVARR